MMNRIILSVIAILFVCCGGFHNTIIDADTKETSCAQNSPAPTTIRAKPLGKNNSESASPQPTVATISKEYFDISIESFIEQFNTNYPDLEIQKNVYGSYSIYKEKIEFILFFFRDGTEIKHNQGGQFNKLLIRIIDSVSYEKEQDDLFKCTILVGYGAAKILDDSFTLDAFSDNSLLVNDVIMSKVNDITYSYSTTKWNKQRRYEFTCEVGV